MMIEKKQPMLNTLVRHSVLLLLLFAAAPSANAAPADSQAAPAKEILPGDSAPALKIDKWLQKGAYDQVQPVGGRLITVIVFWADWCPLSRTVLPMYDKQQAQMQKKGVRFLALAESQGENAKAIMDRLALRNIAVACDDDGTILGQYRGAESQIPVPFAVVMEESMQSAGRVLWKGPAVTFKGSDCWEKGYTTGLDDVLAEIVAGRYDVAAARGSSDTRAQAKLLLDRVQRAFEAEQTDQLRILGKELMSKKWPAKSDSVVSALATAAWGLVSAKDLDKEQLSDGLKMIRAAIELAGEDQGVLLHVYARALYHSGAFGEAVRTEEQAISLMKTYNQGFSKEDCEEALAIYRNAAKDDKTQSPTVEKPKSETEPPKPQEKTEPLDVLTSEQASSDLLALHEHLRLNYAGYDDIAWRLAGEGSSWEKHNAAFLDRVKARKEWPACDLFDLVSEYLSVVRDRHLFIKGTFLRGGNRQTGQSRPTNGVVPFFTDVRVREQDGRLALTKVPEGLSIPPGAALSDIPVIGSPNTVRIEQAYLFPTIPTESADSKEYLLGILVTPSSAPGPVKVSVAADGSDRQEIELPVHRGRQTYTWDKDAPAWSLEDKPLPALTVRRMWGDGLDAMPDTAAILRELPIVALDLRANGGGSDAWASKWLRRFSAQDYQPYTGAAEVRRGESDPLRRWDSRMILPEAPDTSASEQPYRGRLFVVTGIGCGSSGETFATMAGQVRGAVLVGENTGGFVSYGNVDQRFGLPHVDITVQFGRTKFANGGRPVREGIGMFPDYWLDEPDPLTAIAAYCSLK